MLIDWEFLKGKEQQLKGIKMLFFLFINPYGGTVYSNRLNETIIVNYHMLGLSVELSKLLQNIFSIRKHVTMALRQRQNVFPGTNQ